MSMQRPPLHSDENGTDEANRKTVCSRISQSRLDIHSQAEPHFIKVIRQFHQNINFWIALERTVDV